MGKKIADAVYTYRYDLAVLVICVAAIGKSLYFLMLCDPATPEYMTCTVAVYGLLFIAVCAIIVNQMKIKAKLEDLNGGGADSGGG